MAKLVGAWIPHEFPLWPMNNTFWQIVRMGAWISSRNLRNLSLSGMFNKNILIVAKELQNQALRVL